MYERGWNNLPATETTNLRQWAFQQQFMTAIAERHKATSYYPINYTYEPLAINIAQTLTGYGNIPPANPTIGDAWAVVTKTPYANVPTGAWANQQNKLATWSGSSWTFATPTQFANYATIDTLLNFNGAWTIQGLSYSFVALLQSRINDLGGKTGYQWLDSDVYPDGDISGSNINDLVCLTPTSSGNVGAPLYNFYRRAGLHMPDSNGLTYDDYVADAIVTDCVTTTGYLNYGVWYDSGTGYHAVADNALKSWSGHEGEIAYRAGSTGAWTFTNPADGYVVKATQSFSSFYVYKKVDGRWQSQCGYTRKFPKEIKSLLNKGIMGQKARYVPVKNVDTLLTSQRQMRAYGFSSVVTFAVHSEPQAPLPNYNGFYDAPTDDVERGKYYVVSATPTVGSAFAGHANKLAYYNNGWYYNTIPTDSIILHLGNYYRSTATPGTYIDYNPAVQSWLNAVGKIAVWNNTTQVFDITTPNYGDTYNVNFGDRFGGKCSILTYSGSGWIDWAGEIVEHNGTNWVLSTSPNPDVVTDYWVYCQPGDYISPTTYNELQQCLVLFRYKVLISGSNLSLTSSSKQASGTTDALARTSWTTATWTTYGNGYDASDLCTASTGGIAYQRYRTIATATVDSSQAANHVTRSGKLYMVGRKLSATIYDTQDITEVGAEDIITYLQSYSASTTTFVSPAIGDVDTCPPDSTTYPNYRGCWCKFVYVVDYTVDGGFTQL